MLDWFFFSFGVFIVKELKNSIWIWILVLTSICVLVATCLSFFLMAEHLTAYNKPAEQKWIVGCVGIVPVYSLTSFFSLWISSSGTFLSLVSACYEAYTLYSFCMYLIASLGGEKKVIEKLSGKPSSPKSHTPLIHNKSNITSNNLRRTSDQSISNTSLIKHPPFFNLIFAPWIADSSFYRTVKFGVVQYLVLKVFCAVLQLLLSSVNLYGDGSWNWNVGYPYLTLTLNFSQSWAMYVLVMFYRATEKYLFAIRPVGKFLCIKSVVFVTWWQGVLISLLFYLGCFQITKDEEIFEDGAIFQDAIQDILVCIEMAVAAVAHIICFSAEPYREMVFEYKFPTNDFITVLSPMAANDSSMDMDEVIASEVFPRSRLYSLPHSPSSSSSSPRLFRPVATDLMDGIKDVFYNGGKNIANDIQHTVCYTVLHISKTLGFKLLKYCIPAGGNTPEGGISPVVSENEFLSFAEDSDATEDGLP